MNSGFDYTYSYSFSYNPYSFEHLLATGNNEF